MLKNKKLPASPKKELHPGSSIEDAKAVGGTGDFGVPESNVVERTYTSTNTKRSDPTGVPGRAGADGSRLSGAGGANSGPGASSGGDIDTDATLENPAYAPGRTDRPKSESSERIPSVHGSVAQQPDAQSLSGQGADSATNPHRDDDSFAGEVSTDEASGRNDSDE
jgi:hypothetical protein